MSSPKHFSEVTLRDIAKRSGLSLATVSRALRDDPRVKEETIAKIKELAKEMGYRPNPMISSLMVAHKRGRARSELSANIAWLNTHPDKNFWHSKVYTKHLIDPAKERANELGYGFEEIWGVQPDVSPERLQQICHSRNIQGFVVPGPVDILMGGGFPWEAYAVVCLRDKQIGQLDWHRVRPASRRNIEIAYESLRNLGYRRIALACGIYVPDTESKQGMLEYNAGTGEGHSFLLQEGILPMHAGFQSCLGFAREAERIWPFFYDGQPDADLAPLAEWLLQVKPEAVIATGNTIYEGTRLAGLEVPRDLAIAHTNLDDDVSGWAGIDQHVGRQARSAIDMLCAQIERNERGLPEFPKYMHLEGEWCDGWTAPKVG